jgi:hypothetical protein
MRQFGPNQRETEQELGMYFSCLGETGFYY